MSELNTPLRRVSGSPAFGALLAVLCLAALFSSTEARADETAARADEYAPLHTRPDTLTKLDLYRHVPGLSRDAAFLAEGQALGEDAGLYRHVSRNFKFGLRYARAVFSLAPAETAPEDDHYVFLNLVGML